MRHIPQSLPLHVIDIGSQQILILSLLLPAYADSNLIPLRILAMHTSDSNVGPSVTNRLYYPLRQHSTALLVLKWTQKSQIFYISMHIRLEIKKKKLSKFSFEQIFQFCLVKLFSLRLKC